MDEHELYGVPREQFIVERNGLVKALRADGRREEAARVAALRKPSVAAWTVNHLVRTQPDEFAGLLEAGDALRTAQDRMMSGDGTAEELRNALEQERAVVDALVSFAAEQGMNGAVSDRVAGTLHAAALDAGARSQVRSGQLADELQHVGFGGDPLAAGPPPIAPTRRRSKTDAKRAAKHEARTQARHAERDAGRRLEAAERALAHAEQRRANARAALQDAEDALGDAQAETQAASAAHDAAQRALDSLER
jgi:hypothetical protein